jgi:hypothetical protein
MLVFKKVQPFLLTPVQSNSWHYVNNRKQQALKLSRPGLPEKINNGLLV